jgi:hypothetical protein
MDTHESLATGHGHRRCTAEFSRPGIHGDPERPARQVLYVTLGIAACTDPARVIRSTNRDTLKVLTRSDLGAGARIRTGDSYL